MNADRHAQFAALFRGHQPAVRRYVARRAWPDAVDDVVAETFLTAWRRFEDVPADALPWLLETLPATADNREHLEMSPHPGARVIDGEAVDAREDGR